MSVKIYNVKVRVTADTVVPVPADSYREAVDQIKKAPLRAVSREILAIDGAALLGHCLVCGTPLTEAMDYWLTVGGKRRCAPCHEVFLALEGRA